MPTPFRIHSIFRNPILGLVIVLVFAFQIPSFGFMAPQLPKLTVFLNGPLPQVSGKLLPRQPFLVEPMKNEFDEAKIGQIRVTRDSIQLFAPDSVMVGTSGEAAIPSSQIDTLKIIYAGVYKITYHQAPTEYGKPKPVYAGSVRVHPIFTTSPFSVPEDTEFKIKLTFWQGLGCIPEYLANYTISNNRIVITYEKGPRETCVSFPLVCITNPKECPLIWVGPEATIEKLPLGSYKVYAREKTAPAGSEYQVGQFAAREKIVVSGRVVNMDDPRRKGPIGPVKWTTVRVTSDGLGYVGPPTPKDTTRIPVDKSGNFSVALGKTELGIRFLANAGGWHPQSIYHNGHSSSERVAFELIPSSIPAAGFARFKVTIDGTPTENCKIFLNTIRKRILCATKTSTTASVSGPGILSGETDRNGIAIIGPVSLSPHIDYEYTVRKLGTKLRSEGRIRLSPYEQKEVRIELGTAAIAEATQSVGKTITQPVFKWNHGYDRLSIRWPTPTRVENTSVFDIHGRKISAFSGEWSKAIQIDTRNFPGGMYLLHWTTAHGQKGLGRIMIAR